MALLSGLTVAELAEGICLRAGRVAAAQAELLRWVAEFDRREGWAGPGMLSCAHWLSWRVGLSPGAAREQVRIARRLPDLPAVALAFGDGRLSFSKVRAVTRVAEPEDGVDWVELGRHSSAAQLERIVRAMRRASADDRAAADPELAAWQVRTRRRYNDDGNLVLTITARPEYGPVIEAGLAATRAALQRELDAQPADTAPADVPPADDAPVPGPVPVVGVPAGTPSRARVSDGQALLALAEQALAAEQAAHPGTARRRRPLTTRLDPLSGWARQADGELLPPASLRSIARTLPGRGRPLRLRPVTDTDLRREDLGRSQRTVSDRLRELLGVLDGERCRFPGCTRHTDLHAHHVVFWRDGGRTDLANLVLVCPRHHTLIHAQGFQLVLHPDRQLRVSTTSGVPVLHHPVQPWGDPTALAHGPGQHVSAETLPPDSCTTRLDLGYVVAVLLAQAA